MRSDPFAQRLAAKALSGANNVSEVFGRQYQRDCSSESKVDLGKRPKLNSR